MKLLKRFLFRQAERRLRKLPPLYRGQARFRLHYPGLYEYGIGSYGLPKVHDWLEGATLKIGNYCSIAAGVQILLGGQHHPEWLSTYPFSSMLGRPDLPEASFSRGNVVIGSDVWLGSGAIIVSGVSIGHGAVVGAGAVVTRDVAPYSVVSGNPAEHRRWRFDERTRNILLAMAWWAWPAEEIERIAPLLSQGDPARLEEYAARRQTEARG